LDCYGNLNFETLEPSFTKLNIFSKQFKIPDLIKKLNEKGIEAKHLEHKYGSFYQTRLDKLDLFKNIPSLYNCKGYFEIHDNFLSLPLHEEMKQSSINRIVNEIKKIVN